MLAALLLSLWASATTAVDADPPSNACSRALAAMQAREAELAALARADAPPRTPTDARWQALRADAARTCLGRGSAASVPPARSAQPPVAVPPVVVPATPPETAQRRTPAPLPPPDRRPPMSVMSCDAAGCWTSDGARLPHTGRNPLDPRVRCSVQGQVVMCL